MDELLKKAVKGFAPRTFADLYLLARSETNFDIEWDKNVTLSSANVKALAKQITSHPDKLYRLSLSGEEENHASQLSTESISLLAQALRLQRVLCHIRLSHQSLSGAKCSALCSGLRELRQLQTLYLNGCSIGEDGARALGKALPRLHSLRVLE